MSFTRTRDQDKRVTADDLRLREHGAELLGSVALPWVTKLESHFDEGKSAGSRLRSLGPLSPLFEIGGPIGSLLSVLLGPFARPVRAIAFDKNATVNWALGWHQDRTICVKDPAQVAGYSPWTIKHGMHHVEPTIDLLNKMVTIRVHIDPVDKDNAPLKVILGSHKLGLVSENEMAIAVGEAQAFECLADAGDVWIYSTPILHASGRTRSARRRRVLQIDYSADELPHPLEWALELSEKRLRPSPPPPRRSGA